VKTESDTPPQEHGESQNGGCICGNHPFFKFLLAPGFSRVVGDENERECFHSFLSMASNRMLSPRRVTTPR
jgi:hypothetical protein